MTKDEVINEAVRQVTKEWSDKGMILEAGWRAFVITSGLADAPEVQRVEMRKAYYLGAQHLLGSIMSILEPGEEATDGDLHRMDLIKLELDRFMETFLKSN